MDPTKITLTLSDEQLRVLRDKMAEAPYSGEYLYNEHEGSYTCAACGALLFTSDTKFQSHCGWPVFYDIASSDSVRLVNDATHGMTRTEVVCKNCGGHLGHLFDDAPEQPTGMRYCINSISLNFSAKK
jgi:peptide-methionine (R)-S-oxide reductase